MYQLLSYVKYFQFIIQTFIADLFWATWWWTVGVMPDNYVLPPLPHPVGTSKMRKDSNVRRS
jgi:hypothetical protein